jgi:hypothetical protein
MTREVGLLAVWELGVVWRKSGVARSLQGTTEAQGF